MTKKKNNLFNRLKSKFSKSDTDSSSDFEESETTSIYADADDSEVLTSLEDEDTEGFPDIPQEMPGPDKTREINLNQMQTEQYDQEANDSSAPEIFEEKLSLKDKVLSSASALIAIFKGRTEKNCSAPKPEQRLNLTANSKWDSIYNSIFSAEVRPAIHRGFIAILFTLSTYGIGKLAALAIKGTKPNAAVSSASMPRAKSYRAKPAMNSVAKIDLFNAPGVIQIVDPIKKRIAKKSDEKKVCASSNKESTLSIKLINTLILQDSVKSIAAVQIRNNKEILNIREGEKIKNLAKIGRIDRQKIIFKNLDTGVCEYIANQDKKLKRIKPLKILSPMAGKKLLKGQQKGGIKSAGNSLTIPSKVRDQMLSNISEVLTQARAIQITNPDGSLSFKITEIVPDSIYSKLDIQNDDIVKTINGKKISNINEVMKLFGNIRQIDHFELGILRNGVEVNKEYDFN